jgi:formylglycine-generating enzyme required for sulfatase activity
MIPRCAVVALLLLVSLSASAGPDPVAKAKEYVAKGEVQYRLGNFAQALEEFKAALALVSRPNIVLNMAQCYRQLNQPQKAVFYYKLYLTEWERQATGVPPFEREVKKYIKDLAAKASQAPPPPVRPTYMVRITGTPIGARVVLTGAKDKAPGGGEYLGWVPFEQLTVKFGSYWLEITHPKHKPFRQWVWVNPGKPLSLQAKLQPLPSAIRNPQDGGELVLVPAGPFLRGSKEGDGDEDEVPQRKITLDDFYIDKYKVTIAQYRKCVQAGKCSTPGSGGNCNWNESGRDAHPINCINWSQADTYCRWAGKRLPTEAEWEKAARGDQGRTYPWGSQTPTCALAHYNRCAAKDTAKTLPVTALSGSASSYGVVQMVGNVWEWVQDWYGEKYYADSLEKNPAGPSSGEKRVCRGGSWFNLSTQLRAANRYFYVPTDQNFIIGFRCAKGI